MTNVVRVLRSERRGVFVFERCVAIARILNEGQAKFSSEYPDDELVAILEVVVKSLPAFSRSLNDLRYCDFVDSSCFG